MSDSTRSARSLMLSTSVTDVPRRCCTGAVGYRCMTGARCWSTPLPAIETRVNTIPRRSLDRDTATDRYDAAPLAIELALRVQW